MQPTDPRWLEHLDILTAWGEASARNGSPPPTDEQLWAATRMRQDLQLPQQTDRVLLAQLREAFDAGRGPTPPIDLDAVASAVIARGVPARVLHSSGGTATLYTGDQIVDPRGDVRFTTSVGPGWFDGSGYTRPLADRNELGVGPHDDSWGITVPANATIEQIAELIVAVHTEADAQYARFTAAVATSRTAIWSTWAAAYPDASTDDLPDDLDTIVVSDLAALLARWLDQRWPAYHTAPAHLDAAPGS